MKYFSIFFALLIAAPHLSAQRYPAVKYHSPAAGFWENKGQVTDQDGKPRNDILYVFEQDGFTLALAKDFFSYQLTTSTGNHSNLSNYNDYKAEADAKNADWPEKEITYQRTDIRLQGINSNVKMFASEQSAETRNFYNTAGAFSGVHHYKRITYQQVYKGIDLVFYVVPAKGSQTARLKYDFIVHPGADMRMIQLQYSGAFLPAINEAGELISLFGTQGLVKESKPLSYYQAGADSFFAAYMASGNIISFKPVARHNRHQLTIDPEITWSRYFGGNKDEVIEMVEFDANGSIYATGQTFSPVGVVTSGAFQTTKKGVSDCFIINMDSTGTIKWSTYFGGESDEIAFGMCLDGFNNLYVCGQSKSQQVLATESAYQPENHGGIDAFIAKFNTAGILLWSTFLGGAGKDQAYSCVADQGGVYVCGYTESAENIATPNAGQANYAGAGDAFICGFTPSGNILFSTYLGGADQDRAHDLCLDHAGTLMISGTTPSADGIAFGDVHQTVVGGNNDVFIARYSKTGIKKWCTYYGGLKTERGREIITDDAGNSYITGQTASGLYMTTDGVHQTHLNGNGPATDTVYEDAYLAKFDSTGKLKWGTYFGGQKDETGSAIKLLPGKLIAIAGTTLSDSLISTPDAIQPELSGKRDGYIAIFNDYGQLVWSTYYGGSEVEYTDDGYGPALDIYNNQQLIFGISTFSSGLGTLNSYTPSNNATPTMDVLFVDINLQCLDRFEPNNTFESAYDLGILNQPVGVDALINYAGDKDYYTFIKTSDAPVNVYLGNLAQNCDIILYDSLFHPIKLSHHAGLGDEEVTLNKLAKGKFYFLIFNPGSSYSATCYHLNLTKLPAFVQKPAIGENNENDFVFLYPNPAKDETTCYLNSTKEMSTTLSITDLMGKLVMQVPVLIGEGKNEMVLPLGKLLPASYLVYFQNSDVPVQKLVVY